MSECVVNNNDIENKEKSSGDDIKDLLSNDLKSHDIKKLYSINEDKIGELLGECTSSHENDDVASSLIRLEKMLPKNSSCVMNKCILVNNDVEIQTIDLTPVDTDFECPGIVFIAYRPPWWLNFDPITRKRLDTHEE
jgi:hypothetical protein